MCTIGLHICIRISQLWTKLLKCSSDKNDVSLKALYYSETTWAVGIAQLTHHEVQGGGKNPKTEGRGIFAPTADRVVS